MGYSNHTCIGITREDVLDFARQLIFGATVECLLVGNASRAVEQAHHTDNCSNCDSGIP